ncbi:MAG: DKNYY domain-containing protein, partial [Gemmatimonadaceae bacterium]
SFHNLDERYAKDNNSMYYEGVAFGVADVATYTILDGGFAKDKVHGYFARQPIMESDGGTFVAMTGDFSKDAKHVFYTGGMTPNARQGTPHGAYVLKDANPATFTVLESYYAIDSERVYYAGKLLETAAPSFRVLAYDYGVSGSHVYYRGVIVKGADAATFEIVTPHVDSGPTGKDKNYSYDYDKRLKK